MNKILEINANTTDEQIEDAIRFLDMREHAIEQRNYAKAPYEAAIEGKNPYDDDPEAEAVLELHEIDGVAVLWSPNWGYAYVNEQSTGVGSSLMLDNDEANSPEDAAARWTAGTHDQS